LDKDICIKKLPAYLKSSMTVYISEKKQVIEANSQSIIVFILFNHYRIFF